MTIGLIPAGNSIFDVSTAGSKLHTQHVPMPASAAQRQICSVSIATSTSTWHLPVEGPYPGFVGNAADDEIIRGTGYPWAVVGSAHCLAAIGIVGTYDHDAPRLAVTGRGGHMGLLENGSNFVGCRYGVAI